MVIINLIVMIFFFKLILKIINLKFRVGVFDQIIGFFFNVVKCVSFFFCWRLKLVKLVFVVGLLQIELDINEDFIGQFEFNSIEMVKI